MDKPTIQIYEALDGGTALGFLRRDVPIVHVIAKAEGGTRFQVDEHFRECKVCPRTYDR